MLKDVLKALVSMVLIFMFTVVVNVDIGNLGYLSLADYAIMSFLMVSEPSYAMLVAAIPVTVADIILGYRHYCAFSFIIRAIEGYLIVYLTKKKKDYNLSILIVGMLTLFLQVIVDMYLYGSNIMLTSLLYKSLVMIISIVLAGLTRKFKKKVENR
ncbi:MAG TPA: ECF transporter S component [Erysipelotrichaceae bacterium]|nr:ECF transporter S component [Erysipelotrichaceae bacterium]